MPSSKTQFAIPMLKALCLQGWYWEVLTCTVLCLHSGNMFQSVRLWAGLTNNVFTLYYSIACFSWLWEGFVKIRRKQDQNCVMFSYDHKGKAHIFQVLNFTLVVHSVWTAVFFLKSMGALRSAASTFTGLAFFLSRSDKKDSATALFCLAECNVLKSRIAMAAESRTWNLKSK